MGKTLISPKTLAKPPRQDLSTAIKGNVEIVAVLVGLMWIIEVINKVFVNNYLDNFGIRPRTLGGLAGIVFAPFLHGGWPHIIANTVPFAVLAFLVLLRGARTFFFVSVLDMIIGGLGTWLVAPSLTDHIGASGLIFGYLGFLLAVGIFERRFWSIAVAVGVGLAYGGALIGMVPNNPHISWEMHLFGFLGGIYAARLIAGRTRRRTVKALARTA